MGDSTGHLAQGGKPICRTLTLLGSGPSTETPFRYLKARASRVAAVYYRYGNALSAMMVSVQSITDDKQETRAPIASSYLGSPCRWSSCLLERFIS